MQGILSPETLMINAIGGSCQPEAVWHACLPALTLLPNFLLSGVVVIILSVIIAVWAGAFIERKNGSLIMIGLAVLLLLVGGGFIPPMLAMVSGGVASLIHRPLAGWRQRIPERVSHALVALWPWALGAYFLWVLPQWLVGSILNNLMIRYSGPLFIINNILLLLSVFSAVAYQAVHTQSP